MPTELSQLPDDLKKCHADLTTATEMLAKKIDDVGRNSRERGWLRALWTHVITGKAYIEQHKPSSPPPAAGLDALRPFAAMFRSDSDLPDHYVIAQRGTASDLTIITEGDIRRAASALTASAAPSGGVVEAVKVLPRYDHFGPTMQQANQGDWLRREDVLSALSSAPAAQQERGIGLGSVGGKGGCPRVFTCPYCRDEYATAVLNATACGSCFNARSEKLQPTPPPASQDTAKAISCNNPGCFCGTMPAATRTSAAGGGKQDAFDAMLRYLKAEEAWEKFQAPGNGYVVEHCLADLVALGFVPNSNLGKSVLDGCRPWTHNLRKIAMEKLAGGAI